MKQAYPHWIGLFHFLYNKEPEKYNAFTFQFIKLKQIWSIIKLSTPIVLQNLIEYDRINATTREVCSVSFRG